jgi:four helix bundle protein|tara:strand:- start:105 stop:458 length:354 start_codon:yes stop_codon:yes gene_type:complete
MERPYEKLVAWKEAHALCLWSYGVTSAFPKKEMFGLTSQMRRSAYSVPMNIVEGNARRSKGDKRRFYEIALGSLEELHYQIRLARDLNYLPKESLEKAGKQIHRVSYLITKLRNAFV